MSQEVLGVPAGQAPGGSPGAGPLAGGSGANRATGVVAGAAANPGGVPEGGAAAGPLPGFAQKLAARLQAETEESPARPAPGATAAAPARPRGAGSGLAFTPGWDLPSATAGDGARLRWASQQLEALFLEQLWRGMRRTVMPTGMLDGPGVRLFEEMLDQERARLMAEAGTLGLAEMVYEQMSQYIAAPGNGRTTPGGREDM